MEEAVRVVELERLIDPGSLGFSLVWRGEQLEGFLVRRDGAVYAYRNRCPHVGAPLDWSPDQFLDADGRFVQCAMHGALFEIDTGRCVQGPCVNRSLEPLAVSIRADAVWLLP